jgi:hypothetical protein
MAAVVTGEPRHRICTFETAAFPTARAIKSTYSFSLFLSYAIIIRSSLTEVAPSGTYSSDLACFVPCGFAGPETIWERGRRCPFRVRNA